MKLENVAGRLMSYRMTFNDLHIPFLALAQLYIAYFRAFMAGTINNGLGIPRTFVLGFHQLWVSLIFGVFALCAGKSFKISIRSIHHVIICGILQVAMAGQFFSRGQMENGPFIAACYQPIVPAMSTMAAIILSLERGSSMKYFGIFLCIFATSARGLYDFLFSDYEIAGDQFRGKFFILGNVFMLSIGVFFQKKSIQHNPNVSLMVLIFYIFGVGFLTNVIIYIFKFWGSRVLREPTVITNEDFEVFFSFKFFTTLLNVMSIYKMLILAEAYRYIALIYINKKGQISKVTFYGALHGFFVVIIILIFGSTTTFDKVFIAMITLAYIMLFGTKYVETRSVKRSTTGKRIKFKRFIHGNEVASQLMETANVSVTLDYFKNSNASSGKSDGGTVLSERVPSEWSVKHFRSSINGPNALGLTYNKKYDKKSLFVNQEGNKRETINISISSDSMYD